MEPDVRRVVADVLGVTPTELAPAVSLVDDLAADSLDLVEIGLGLEATVGVSIPDPVLERIRTYGDLLAALRRPTGGQGGVRQRAGRRTPATDASDERTCTM